MRTIQSLNRLALMIALPPPTSLCSPKDGERVAGEALTEIRDADWIELMLEQDFKKVRRAQSLAGSCWPIIPKGKIGRPVQALVRHRKTMNANSAIARMVWWGFLAGVGMTAFFFVFGVAIPIRTLFPIFYRLNGLAFGLVWLWHTAGLPIWGMMPLVFVFSQWFLVGALLGLWRCHRESRKAELAAPPNGGPAEQFGNSGVGGGPPSVIVR